MALKRSGPIVINTDQIVYVDLGASSGGELCVSIQFAGDSEPVFFTGGNAQEAAGIIMAESRDINAPEK